MEVCNTNNFPGCYCKPNYVRHEGACISLSECPSKFLDYNIHKNEITWNIYSNITVQQCPKNQHSTFYSTTQFCDLFSPTNINEHGCFQSHCNCREGYGMVSKLGGHCVEMNACFSMLSCN